MSKVGVGKDGVETHAGPKKESLTLWVVRRLTHQMSRAPGRHDRTNAYARRLQLRVRQHIFLVAFLRKHLLISIGFDVLAKHDPHTVDIAYGKLANPVGLICGPRHNLSAPTDQFLVIGVDVLDPLK